MEKNNDDKSLEIAKELINSLKEQFDMENEKLREYRREIFRERDFKVSKFYYYSGPNYYLSTKALVFNIFIAPSGPNAQFLKEFVVKDIPKIAEIDTPFVIDLYVQTLLQVLKMDIDLFVNKFSISRMKDEYVVAVECLDDKIAEECVHLVSDWFRAISDDRRFDFQKEWIKLQAAFDKTLFGGPTIYSLIEAGLKMNIPVFYLYEENQFQWGYGKKQLRGRSTTFHTDGIKDTEFTMYKDMVGDFLEMCGFPTPNGVNCFEENAIVAEAKEIGFPVVVKPVAGHKGQGVTTGIMSEEEVKIAFRKIVDSAKADGVNFEGALVQKQIFGTDHRLLAVGGKFVAALERVPAYVDGDGKQNIEQLIVEENAKIIRLDNARSPLCKIKIDDNLIEFLKLQNLSLESVPKQGERITLRRVANISAGGVSINVSDKIHPVNVQLVEDIARYFNVKCMGIDVLSADISKPWTEGNFGIIEINAGPGVFMHLAPAYGGSIDVPKHIMLTHFKPETSGRIPIIATNRTSGHLVSLLNNKLHEIKSDCYFCALTHEGVFFNNRYFFNNKSHEQNVKMILRQPKADIALFTHTREDIYDYGILHEGADIVILDDPDYAEEVVLKDQLAADGLLLEIYDGEIIAFKGGVKKEAAYFANEEEKAQKIMALIGASYLNELFIKYEI